MSVEEYRYYAKLCRKCGITTIIIGIVLPILTAHEIRYRYDILPSEWTFPYVGYGIAIVIVGMGLLIFSKALLRGRKIRTRSPYA